MLASFGWIFFVLVGLAVLGLACYVEISRRKRAAEERRAVWKAHDEWLQSSNVKPPEIDIPRMRKR